MSDAEFDAEFNREWEKWNNLLRYARRVNDIGGERLCERKLGELMQRFRAREGFGE